MIKEIKMPAGGQTTDVSQVVAWHVKEGDLVKRGDILLEIETDKAIMTIESFTKGTVLKILLPAGESAGAGTVLCLIGDEQDRAELESGASVSQVKEPSPELQAEPQPTEPTKRPVKRTEYLPIDRAAWQRGEGDLVTDERKASPPVKAMPNAKLMAAEHHVDLAAVAKFTGRDIIRRRDVAEYLKHGVAAEAIPTQDQEDEIIPMTGMRKVIARRMSESAREIPVYTVTIEADMTNCIQMRTMLKERGETVSFNDIIIKCAQAAIRKFPMINASVQGDSICLLKQVNFGLAVAIENGLVVPVVKNVQNLTLLELAAANRENVQKARNGKLSPSDMSGGTISLSNLGIFPVDHFTAIINPPEVCILALGAIVEKPVCRAGTVGTAPLMTVTASFDHRIIDGAYGAGYLTELKTLLEQPTLALV